MATSSKPSTLDVSNAIKRLTVEETRVLVFQMGVPLEDVDNITERYSGDMQRVRLVQKWLDMNPNASWDKLVAGLKRINLNSLASEIESEHLSKAVVASSGSSPLSVSAGTEHSTPSHLVTETKAPVGSLPPAPLSVTDAKKCVENLQDEFLDLKSEARQSLSQNESQDPNFIGKFRDYLMDMPVAKKQVHIRFFARNEEEILAAKTIQKLFIILGHYCNYSNYEIIFHIVKRFCHKLQERMLKYRDSLIIFEKSTTVDVYLCVISAPPAGKIREGFLRMTMKINKPSSECTLYEIRELKESIEKEASLESYAMYIETPGEGSVCVRFLIPWQAHFMVTRALTPEFIEEAEVAVKRWAIEKDYPVRAVYIALLIKKLSLRKLLQLVYVTTIPQCILVVLGILCSLCTYAH